MNQNMKTLILFGLVGLIATSCHKTETTSSCDKTGVLSEIDYNDASKDDVQILEADITGDCLRLKYASSGCDGNSWIVELVARESISVPAAPTIMARLSMDNKELCEAYFVKEMTFDISSFKVVDATNVTIILQDHDMLLEYDY